MDADVVFSPAKINVFLAVTGRRPDGFHELVSVVAPLEFGDTLTFEEASPGQVELRCAMPDLPTDESNLVVRAARLFARVTGWRGGVRITLDKRIPIGAGLGGGSSNAAATLRTLNRRAGSPLDAAALAAMAAEVGSDCPLFLAEGPVVMRGRGERLAPLPGSGAGRLVGRRLLLFKPAFGIQTAWAYRELAGSQPGAYLPTEDAEERLGRWLDDPGAPAEDLLYNTLEVPVFGKFLALPTLLDYFRAERSWRALMSGSGSACFGFLAENQPFEPLREDLRLRWGESSFAIETWIRGGPGPNPS